MKEFDGTKGAADALIEDDVPADFGGIEDIGMKDGAPADSAK